MKKILVVLPLNERQKKSLSDQFPDFRFLFIDAKNVTEEMVNQSSAIIGNIPASLLHANSSLELVQLNSAGADAYIKPGILSPGTVLSNASGAYNKTVAEHAFALSLMLMKNLYLYRDNQKQNSWKDMGKAASFENAKVLIVGCGNIGLRFAKYAKAFGATTIGVKTHVSGPVPDELNELLTNKQLPDAISEADVIVSFLPQTVDTIHIFDKAMFSRMKSSAIFVNCGRGSSVDPDALEWALKNGIIASAAIDVCEEEPLPSSSTLWDIENLVITPHTAGGYHLDDTLDQIFQIVVKNLAALRDNSAFINIINREKGY